MNLALQRRDLKSSLLAIGLVFGAAGLLLAMASVLSLKLVLAAVFGALCILVAYFSGNPRLFCLWGLAVTIPFALSKT